MFVVHHIGALRMRTDVDLHDVPARFTELLALANAGHKVVIIADGTARAMLIPLTAETYGGRILGLRPGSIILGPDFDDPLPEDIFPGNYPHDPLLQ